MENNEEFKLSKEELESPLWKKMEGLFLKELDTARKINDKKLDIDDTFLLRGRISAFKGLLMLNPDNEDI